MPGRLRPGLRPAGGGLYSRRPPCQGDYFALFRCPIRFNAPVAHFVFDRALVERPLPASNRELARANDAILCSYIDQLVAGDIISRVKTAVLDHLPSGPPGSAVIAKDLFMSARTFQRRLADAGTTYSDILDAVRRELASQYINDPALSLREISYLLGFADLSGFSRAFRRWTGHPPSAVREGATV